MTQPPQQPPHPGWWQASDGNWYPPQPPTAPQVPPKKKHTVRNILLGIVIGIVLIVGGCMAMVGGAVNSVNKEVHKNDGKTVVYEITSDSGSASDITYSMNNGQQQETDASTPWSKTFTTDSTGFQSFILSASNGTDGSDGAISCKITVDGKVVANQTSKGQFANVTCSAT